MKLILTLLAIMLIIWLLPYIASLLYVIVFFAVVGLFCN